MRTKGKIISWNEEKGFGFIRPNTDGNQVFIHITAFHNRKRRPEIGGLVTYALSTDKQGRPCAVSATLAGDRLPQKTKYENNLLPVIVAVSFLIFVVLNVVTSKLPLLIFIIYILVSLLSFVMYAFDKSAAKKGDWRIAEDTLHLLSLAGGWPGALIAQQKLRHKSKKQSFRSAFWGTVFLNCCLLIWFLTPDGIATLNSLGIGVI